MSDSQMALWVTLWLIGGATCVGLYVLARRDGNVGARSNRIRSLILLGALPCGGFNFIIGLVFFAVYKAGAAVSIKKRARLIAEYENQSLEPSSGDFGDLPGSAIGPSAFGEPSREPPKGQDARGDSNPFL